MVKNLSSKLDKKKRRPRKESFLNRGETEKEDDANIKNLLEKEEGP